MTQNSQSAVGLRLQQGELLGSAEIPEYSCLKNSEQGKPGRKRVETGEIWFQEEVKSWFSLEKLFVLEAFSA